MGRAAGPGDGPEWGEEGGRRPYVLTQAAGAPQRSGRRSSATYTRPDVGLQGLPMGRCGAGAQDDSAVLWHDRGPGHDRRSTSGRPDAGAVGRALHLRGDQGHWDQCLESRFTPRPAAAEAEAGASTRQGPLAHLRQVGDGQQLVQQTGPKPFFRLDAKRRGKFAFEDLDLGPDEGSCQEAAQSSPGSPGLAEPGADWGGFHQGQGEEECVEVSDKDGCLTSPSFSDDEYEQSVMGFVAFGKEGAPAEGHQGPEFLQGAMLEASPVREAAAEAAAGDEGGGPSRRATRAEPRDPSGPAPLERAGSSRDDIEVEAHSRSWHEVRMLKELVRLDSRDDLALQLMHPDLSVEPTLPAGMRAQAIQAFKASLPVSGRERDAGSSMDCQPDSWGEDEAEGASSEEEEPHQMMDQGQAQGKARPVLQKLPSRDDMQVESLRADRWRRATAAFPRQSSHDDSEVDYSREGMGASREHRAELGKSAFGDDGSRLAPSGQEQPCELQVDRQGSGPVLMAEPAEAASEGWMQPGLRLNGVPTASFDGEDSVLAVDRPLPTPRALRSLAGRDAFPGLGIHHRAASAACSPRVSFKESGGMPAGPIPPELERLCGLWESRRSSGGSGSSEGACSDPGIRLPGSPFLSPSNSGCGLQQLGSPRTTHGPSKLRFVSDDARDTEGAMGSRLPIAGGPLGVHGKFQSGPITSRGGLRGPGDVDVRDARRVARVSRSGPLISSASASPGWMSQAVGTPRSGTPRGHRVPLGASHLSPFPGPEEAASPRAGRRVPLEAERTGSGMPRGGRQLADAPGSPAVRRVVDGAEGGEEGDDVRSVFLHAKEKGSGAVGIAMRGITRIGKQMGDLLKPSTSSVLGIGHRSVTEWYSLGKVLGKGQFGVTRVAESKYGGRVFACKSISKTTLKCKSDVDDVRREHAIFELLRGLPHVPRIQDTFEDPEDIHFVMELCTGGDLFDRLKQRRRFPEAEAAAVLRTVLEVLRFCHERHLVHRDIKPENVLLCSADSDIRVKIIDFGIAAQMKPGGKPLTELMGSPFYIAPEVIDGSYGCQADVWSAGVLFYVLLVGVPPFWAKTQAGIFRAIKEGRPNVDKPYLSDDARDLLQRLLTRDPGRRPTAKAALGHPVLVGVGDLAQGPPPFQSLSRPSENPAQRGQLVQG